MAGAGERPKSRDVAKLAGVSHTAVSFVFNGKAEGNLSEATTQRILAAAQELGYRPNPIARGLRRRRTAVIGLVTDHIASSPFAGPVLRGAMQTAWEREHLVLVVDSMGDQDREDAAVAELLARRVDGILYAAMSLRTARVPLGLEETRTTFANCLPDDETLFAVVPAERAGGRAAAELLLAEGHRLIATIGGERGDLAGADRVRGFRDALRAADVTPREDWVLRAGGEVTNGYEGALRLLDGVPARERPTGVVCYNDRVAAGVLHAAARLGLDVPGDLSVVGYDDQEHMAAYLAPPLTTVALPHYAMGETAMTALLEAVDTQGQPPAEVRRLPCPVVRRASVGPVPSR